MRILLIMPDAHMHKLRLGSLVWSFREAPLTLTTLAAIDLKVRDVEYVLVDESVERVPLDAEVDLVGISTITGCAQRAYALADHYRARGIPTILGGIHVTLMPEEAARHADAIVLGMAESVWPRVVNDVRRGCLQPRYCGSFPQGDLLENVPAPRRELQHGRYMMPNTIQASRGCRRHCEFCVVPHIWPRFFKRPVADVIRDVRLVQGRYFAFNDVSLLEDREYARELLSALIPLHKQWGGLCTTDIERDTELMDLLTRSGCRYLLIGFESLSTMGLRDIRKGFNHVDRYRQIVMALHEHNISVQACFVFGLDSDDQTVFASTVDWINQLQIDIPRYSLYTAFPGTPLFQQLEDQGRILSHNWEDYDTMHVVVRPLGMTPEQLYDGFRWAYRETFRALNVMRRLRGFSINSLVNLVGNCAYRIFVHRLYHEDRFRDYCHPLPTLWEGQRPSCLT